MSPQTTKSKPFKGMSNDELTELQSGFIDLRNHANKHLEAILKEVEDRLKQNLVT
jgi:hypothetical protein